MPILSAALPRPLRCAVRLAGLALGLSATACHTIKLEPDFMPSPPAVEHLLGLKALVTVGDECLPDELADWCDLHRFHVTDIQFWARESFESALGAAFASLDVRQSASAKDADVLILPSVSLEVSGIVGHEALVQMTLVAKNGSGDVVASATGTGRSSSTLVMWLVEGNIRAAFRAALVDAVNSFLPALDAWSVRVGNVTPTTSPADAGEVTT